MAKRKKSVGTKRGPFNKSLNVLVNQEGGLPDNVMERLLEKFGPGTRCNLPKVTVTQWLADYRTDRGLDDSEPVTDSDEPPRRGRPPGTGKKRGKRVVKRRGTGASEAEVFDRFLATRELIDLMDRKDLSQEEVEKIVQGVNALGGIDNLKTAKERLDLLQWGANVDRESRDDHDDVDESANNAA